MQNNIMYYISQICGFGLWGTLQLRRQHIVAGYIRPATYALWFITYESFINRYLRSPGICDVFGGRIWGIHSPNRAWSSNPDNRQLLIKNRDFPIPVKVYFVEKRQRVVWHIGCVSLPINLEQICLMRLLCRNRIPSHRDQAVNF